MGMLYEYEAWDDIVPEPALTPERVARIKKAIERLRELGVDVPDSRLSRISRPHRPT